MIVNKKVFAAFAILLGIGGLLTPIIPINLIFAGICFYVAWRVTHHEEPD